MGVVYGGARDGTMGAVANGAMSVGRREAIGVSTAPIVRTGTSAPESLTKLHVVDSMHERKQRYARPYPMHSSVCLAV